MKPLIYLDNNATTMVAPQVVEAMLPFFTEKYGNASSMHSFGGQVGRNLSAAREQVAALLGAQPDEIIFTSCGTESDNMAILSALLAQPEKKHIITTRVEHPAVLNTVKFWEKRGYEATYLGVDGRGRLDLDELRDAIRPDTALVSIMFANNEVGNIYPIKAASEIAAARGVLFHTDAVQAAGKIPFSVADMPVNYLALSGHKIYAPKGIGVLYARRGSPVRPLLNGGHQERGRRGGTENIPYIVGLGVACDLARQYLEEENTRVAALRDRLEAGILKSVPDTIVNGDPEHRLPNTTSIAFKYVEGEAILLLLDEHNIAASSGSACTSGSLEPSHVLRAMGVPFTYAHGSIRFSLSRYNTEEQMDTVITVMPPIIDTLRKISPYREESGKSASCRCQ